MQNYLGLMSRVLQSCTQKEDRTGTGTISTFGEHLKIDLRQGFPLLTTKKVHFKSIAYELLWFLRGDTNIKYLNEHGVTIWDEWADENGGLGPIYGKQWRDVIGVDQIDVVIDCLINDPDSRRMIVDSWSVPNIHKMALPPCHCLFQFYSIEMTNEEKFKYWSRHHLEWGKQDMPNRWLSCQVYQRSADIFLGVPFNIASYALLMHMIGHVTKHVPLELHFAFGDLHLYRNHIEQAKFQLDRLPYNLPTLKLNKEVENIDEFIYEDFKVLNYKHYPAIKAKVAV